METLAAKMPKPLADEVDRLIASGMYANRSEVLRVAVRALVKSGGAGEDPRSDPPIAPRVRAFYRRLRELTKDGRDRVVGMPALVDPGSDLCVFPASLAQGLAPEKGEPVVILEMADGRTVDAPLVYPSITAGNLRETEVASAILPDAPAILGRSD